ncbi:hypothetical protein T440DRAFT_408313 [Plenodomus tracheiphilus IPT5]|uniref:Putative gamma-glutamylcyclotransferase n=1 Tax=Plenodomus tracheiphilus IPT5 TaxID=1408161 RepID=A0A6A7APQ0_9PLEO|nr:hypothetical protein T440DRAFT_408313 [Plenodomus tracheiphilus IPT5]
MSHTAFFYGTLMAAPVLQRVIWGSATPPTPAHASLLTVRPAILHAHRRHKVKDADYPAVLPTKRHDPSTVRGTLVEGLTDGDIWRLDIFEGPEYRRRKVKVQVLPQPANGKKAHGAMDMSELTEPNDQSDAKRDEVEAETYIWVAGARRLEPEEWDFDEFVKDKMKHWVGGEATETDEGFQDVDDAVAVAVSAQKDPTGGRGANGSISQQLHDDAHVSKTTLNSAV